MKKLICIAFITVLFLSCNANKAIKKDQTSTSQNELLGKQLLENDFLKFVDATKRDSLKAGLIKSFDIYNEDNFRIVDIDAEELAECNFDFFLPNLNRILAKRNVVLDVKISEKIETSHEIILNGEVLKLYTDKELKNETFWDQASRSFFKRVNEILKNKNLDEKFYLLYAGNDLEVMLITEKQFKIIAERHQNEKNEIPYLP